MNKNQFKEHFKKFSYLGGRVKAYVPAEYPEQSPIGDKMSQSQSAWRPYVGPDGCHAALDLGSREADPSGYGPAQGQAGPAQLTACAGPTGTPGRTQPSPRGQYSLQDHIGMGTLRL